MHTALILILAATTPGSGQIVQGKAEVVSGERLIVNGVALRLSGISAPRPMQYCQDRIAAPYPCGALAEAALDTLVKDKVIHCLTRDGEASCSAGGQDLGLAMLAQGQAVASQNRPTSAAYRKAAAQAKAQKRGLWHGSFIDPEAWDAAVGQNPMVRRP